MEKTIANNMWNKKELKIYSIFVFVIIYYFIYTFEDLNPHKNQMKSSSSLNP